MLQRILFALFSVTLLTAEEVPGRYIVELSDAPVVDHLGRQRNARALYSAEATNHRQQLRRGRDRIARQLLSGERVLDYVENVGNAVFVEMSESRARRLAAMPGVRSVRPVRTYKLLLDRAVVVNRIAEAWNRVGDSTAGAGVKVAVIDTGVDAQHPGLQAGGLRMPEGFPKVNVESDAAFTNPKIIAARSYVTLLPRRDTDNSAQDRVGHGTALAMIIAGLRTAAPLATIQGVAPGAQIGSYKVFGSPGVNDTTTNAAIMKAIDDAVADGMDIINLSLGSDIASRIEDDELVAAVERASQAGVLVITAAGNNGPDFGTVGSPATAPATIAVGAVSNDRFFASTVEVPGVAAFLAIRSTGPAPADAITGRIVDAGLACEPLPSLTGAVALILRGTCAFEQKLNNAQAAGAVAAIVYATAAAPDPFTMSVGAATLPAMMVSHAAGLALSQQRSVAIRFALGPVATTSGKLEAFSSIGPSVNHAVKPDLTAVGSNFYMATQKLDPRGDMYSADGYLVAQGTSFACPLVAGAAALLKSARNGLTVDQYRSLLINTADGAGTVMKNGAGLLRMDAALQSTVSAYPTAFGIAANDPAERSMQLTNLSGAEETYTVVAESRTTDGLLPVIDTATVSIAPGGTADIPVRFIRDSTRPGAQEGFLIVRGAISGSELRVPYWSHMPSQRAAAIPILQKTATGRRGTALRNALLFRVVDDAGMPLDAVTPVVTVLTGGGTVTSVTSLDSESPGLFSLSLRLGTLAGENRVRIEAAGFSTEVSFTAQ